MATVGQRRPARSPAGGQHGPEAMRARRVADGEPGLGDDAQHPACPAQAHVCAKRKQDSGHFTCNDIGRSRATGMTRANGCLAHTVVPLKLQTFRLPRLRSIDAWPKAITAVSIAALR
jgi:hypothetical protein